MSLDFHISVTEKNALKTHPDLQMNVLMHTKLFSKKNDSMKFLNKIQDYYSDTIYEYKDLNFLMNEVISIVDGFNDIEVIEFLGKLQSVIIRAIELKQNLFIFAD